MRLVLLGLWFCARLVISIWNCYQEIKISIQSLLMSELKKEPIVKIVNYLKENEEITTAKGVEITGKSEAQVRRYLKVLCNLGIIKSNRTTKGNVYVRI
jgi:predicted HTH transcriptional regulator